MSIFCVERGTEEGEWREEGKEKYSYKKEQELVFSKCRRTKMEKALTECGEIQGNNILITGIGGGVALMVLLFAVKMNIRVWVTSSSADKLARAKELGAAGGVSYKEEGWEKKLKTMMPKERPWLDAIIDGAGGDIVAKGVRLLKVSIPSPRTLPSTALTPYPLVENNNCPRSCLLTRIAT